MENRTLYTLVNPELYFGERSYYSVMQAAPGESLVIAYFRSETDFLDKVLDYADMVCRVDDGLYVSKNEIYQEGPYQVHVSWRFASSDDFWYDYSFCEDNADEITLLYGYDDYYDEYKVTLYIEGYQNCEFLAVNPYERVTSEDNTPADTQASTPAEKSSATATPKPQVKATATPAPNKTQELVAQEINTATAVQPPKNAFQDFASWSMGAAIAEDAEQSGDSVQYLDYKASQETIDAYIEMLQQNGFTLVDDYFFQYKSDPFASWGLNCDYVPNAGEVEMTYESSKCHLCIYTSDAGEYTFHYSSDLTQYDLGLRMDGSVAEATSVSGPSAGAGLYRLADGVYQTSDGRLSTTVNQAMVIRDGVELVCDARNEVKNNREWLWIENYYRNEAICFELPENYTIAGDIYQLQDLKREKYYHDTDGKSVNSYKWGNQPLFVMSVNDLFVGPLVTEKNKFEAVTVRVMYYEKDVEAVYYIYANTSGTPSEIEVLCAVSLEEKEEENSAENTIVLSVGDTYKLNYDVNVFGTLAEVYTWSVADGDAVYVNGAGKNCTVTAMKAGVAKVTVSCRYTVETADVLTGFPTTTQRTKSKTWYFEVK